MANPLTSWILTIIGILYLLQASTWVPALDSYYLWLYGLGFLIIGVAKLIRVYKN